MKPIDLSRLHALRMANDEFGYTLADTRERFDKLKTRHEDGTAPQAIAVHQLFQTPQPLAERMASMLPQSRGQRILEPSAGLGRLLDAVKPLQPSQIVAVECHSDCMAELYRQEREGVALMQRNFLTLDADQLGRFDCIIMNPPFTIRSDIRHILHAMTFLKPGGKIVALCMDTHHRETILKPLASSWEKIPEGTFAKEGTRIACVLLTVEA